MSAKKKEFLTNAKTVLKSYPVYSDEYQIIRASLVITFNALHQSSALWNSTEGENQISKVERNINS